MHAVRKREVIRKFWIKVLRYQWGKCNKFRYNNWPGPLPRDIPLNQARSYPAFQIERWRFLSVKEEENLGFAPDGITLIGALNAAVYKLLVEQPEPGHVCKWFDIALCADDLVLFHSQDWGEHTRLLISSSELETLRIPSFDNW